MPGRLEHKIALITGAASGIGKQIARRFAEQGARVVLADFDTHKLESIASEIGGESRSIELDVTSLSGWHSAVADVKNDFNRLDILVNSAGIAVADDHIESPSPESFDRVMAVNLGGTVNACRMTLPLLRVNGGSIINLGSIRSHVASADTLAYSSSKFAVLGFTRSLALYCAKNKTGIRVNAICPGVIRTEMHDQWTADLPDREAVERELIAQYPIGRLGEPDDVAWLAVYLASDESGFVTGAHFNVDGGFTA